MWVVLCPRQRNPGTSWHNIQHMFAAYSIPVQLCLALGQTCLSLRLFLHFNTFHLFSLFPFFSGKHFPVSGRRALRLTFKLYRVHILLWQWALGHCVRSQRVRRTGIVSGNRVHCREKTLRPNASCGIRLFFLLKTGSPGPRANSALRARAVRPPATPGNVPACRNACTLRTRLKPGRQWAKSWRKLAQLLRTISRQCSCFEAQAAKGKGRLSKPCASTCMYRLRC